MVQETIGNLEQELWRQAETNLSDFAFFLSVMKNKKAYQNVLEMILGENIELEEVKVEEVILNRKGKRAIRLDAWARSKDDRQFAVEMQNDTERDDVRKRSRYYQGLIDSPILKAGRKTLYKMLPATVIIFITQEDIFGRDVAMYTFTERCTQFPELELGDGTTKIFLNMASKNGRAELVSLLQYMKRTDLENPEIREKSRRLLELDEIVQEVRRSEEWEDASMSFLSLGMTKGKEIGQEIGKELGREEGRICQEIKTVLWMSEQGYGAENLQTLVGLGESEIAQILSWKESHPQDGEKEIYTALFERSQGNEV